MIEELLEANGFHEVYAFLDQPHIGNELVEIADRARRGEEAGKEAENSAVAEGVRGVEALGTI